MNRTHRITSDWLSQSGLVGDELLLEGLLRRGFLAYRDDQGVWLGTGSHPKDLDVLRLVRGLEVEAVSGHKDRMARVKLRSTRGRAMDVAIRIIALPENHFEGNSQWTGAGLDLHSKCNWSLDGQWRRYRKMSWGAKLPVLPNYYVMEERPSRVNSALDLGVALLVKAFPLARVATGFCCDGHGERPAEIGFCFNWDGPWAEAVFDALADTTPNSMWSRGGETITPHGGFGDAEVMGMLNDIQHFARRLMNQNTIEKIGRARARTLEAFGEDPPSAERFVQEARTQLNEEFA